MDLIIGVIPQEKPLFPEQKVSTRFLGDFPHPMPFQAPMLYLYASKRCQLNTPVLEGKFLTISNCATSHHCGW